MGFISAFPIDLGQMAQQNQPTAAQLAQASQAQAAKGTLFSGLAAPVLSRAASAANGVGVPDLGTPGAGITAPAISGPGVMGTYGRGGRPGMGAPINLQPFLQTGQNGQYGPIDLTPGQDGTWQVNGKGSFGWPDLVRGLGGVFGGSAGPGQAQIGGGGPPALQPNNPLMGATTADLPTTMARQNAIDAQRGANSTGQPVAQVPAGGLPAGAGVMGGRTMNIADVGTSPWAMPTGERFQV